MANVTGTANLKSNASILCYSPTMITTNGIFAGYNALNYAYPLFVLQMTMVVVITRCFCYLLKPLHQPRFIAEVMGGVVLGPSVMGRIPNYMEKIFPRESLSTFETMAHLGLFYFIFLVGLQIDVRSVNRLGKRTWAVALSGVVLPFVIETLAFLAFGKEIRRQSHNDAYLLFLASSLSVTAFSVLARVLAVLKLLNSDTGHLTLSSALVTDGLAWILLAIAIALAGTNRSGISSVGAVGSGTALFVATYFIVRPAAAWVVSHTPEGEPIKTIHLILTLLAVMASGVMADAVGMNAVFGAFVFGLAVPDGPLVTTLIEKLEDFVTGLLLPLYFASNGSRVRLESIRDAGISGFLAGVIIFASIARVAATMVVSTFCYGYQAREGLLLGILMNTKGIVEMVILRIALDKHVLYTQSYSMMVVMSVILTAAVTPLATLVSKPGRRLVHYKRRMLQRLKPDGELRVLACIHTAGNVPSLVNLLEVSHPTKNSPIFVCAVQLIELTGRESTMMVVHDTQNVGGSIRKRGRQQSSVGKSQPQPGQIMSALENYEQHAAGVSVYPMIVVSPYSTMHEDVERIAEDKRTTLLILPFHKEQTVDGRMEVINQGIHVVNENILDNPPCTVAILVDRGLGGTARLAASMGRHTVHHVALLFFGGPDDREALCYAGRMAQHPSISVTVFRFIDVTQTSPKPSMPSSSSSSTTGMGRPGMIGNHMSDREKERTLDDTCVTEFRLRNAGIDSVVYSEKMVSSGEEILVAIRSIDRIHDLYVVGRGNNFHNPMLAALTDWSECPELGVVGDLLASSDFASSVSVLVVQQYKECSSVVREPPASPASPRNNL